MTKKGQAIPTGRTLYGMDNLENLSIAIFGAESLEEAISRGESDPAVADDNYGPSRFIPSTLRTLSIFRTFQNIEPMAP